MQETHKKPLRRLYLAQRKALKNEQLIVHSKAIATHFVHLLEKSTPQPKYIHVFIPIVKNNEIDTWLIIRNIWENFPHIQLVASVTDFEDKVLRNFIWKPDTVLRENDWGIPEPQNAEPINDVLIDWVIVPLLCFDKRGYRVGYGGGFYDRFLQKCRPGVVKVGVSLFPAIPAIEDVDTYDIPLTHCITPQTAYVWKT